MPAEFRVLFTGYIHREAGLHIASTVSFVRDGDVLVIIDPGMVPASFELLRALEGLASSPEEITDVTTLVATSEGTIAFTHLWWSADGPAEDPRASDPAALHRNRQRVLELAAVIVPGHGAPFPVTPQTPR